jgi:hypothetical protein
VVKVDECLSGPEFQPQLFPGDDFPRLFQQSGEYLEGLLLEGYSLSTLAQFPRPKIDFEDSEPNQAS